MNVANDITVYTEYINCAWVFCKSF